MPQTVSPATHRSVGRVRTATLAIALVVATWAVVGFAIFSPDAPCGDCRVKYVQAQSLIRSGFRSMALAYPGAVFDGAREFFPFRPPFTLNTPRGVQSIWSPVVVLAQTPFVLLTGDFGGLIALSLACGAIILWLSVRLGGRTDDWMLPVVLGFGTCLWYYAVQPWEHAPAVAAIMGGSWLAWRTRNPVYASVLFGAGVILRYETLLLLPLLLLLVWHRHRRLGALIVSCAGVGAVVVAAALLDFFVYGRPPAAHLLQVVGVLRTVFKNSFPAYELPAVPTLSFADRYDTVLHYWLTSSLSRPVVIGFGVAVVVAAGLARWRRSSVGVLAVALIVLCWSSYQLWYLVPGPRSIPGLFNLSPFLVFALFPSARLAVPAPGGTASASASPAEAAGAVGAAEADSAPQARATGELRPTTYELPIDRALLLSGCAIAIFLAILTTDTAGGKSLGPRMLLGLVPPLTIAAWEGIRSYQRAGRTNLVLRAIGWAGMLLVVVSIGINICALRAWAGRFDEEHQSIAAVEQSPVPIVIADDQFTAQSFMPLYFRKVLLLADNPAAARHAGALLQQARVPVVLLVSRDERPRVSLDPYHLLSSRRAGRVTLQEWIR